MVSVCVSRQHTILQIEGQPTREPELDSRYREGGVNGWWWGGMGGEEGRGGGRCEITMTVFQNIICICFVFNLFAPSSKDSVTQ